MGSYFWGKSLAELPFQLIYPIVAVSIVYFAVGLNEEANRYFILCLICILVYWAGTSYGLFLSVVIPKFELAMALVPIVLIPLMIMGGFYVN